MGQTEIKYSLKIECFTNRFFKTFRRAGIFRTKKYPRRIARGKFYQICLKDFFEVFVHKNTSEKKISCFAHLRAPATP